jgi:DNA-binding LacI/PurR family transcriptional regulator
MTESPTRLKDLARMAGVSIATVSRALNDHPGVNLKTKRQLWALARAHDYPFRRTMPAGPIGAEATIAMVVTRPQGRADRLDDPFALELVAGVTEAARERGCDVLLSHVHPDGYDELEAIMGTSRADGVVFLGQSLLHTAFNRLAARERRFVVWGAQLPGQAYCSVGSDNPLGGRRATAHLLRLGRRRIVFLGDTDAVEAAQRLQGWRAAHAEADVAADEALVVPAHFEVEAAEAAVDGLLARGAGFDGVVAASDLIALGAMRALARAGRRVPADVSVVGYDDVPFARYAAPALTTVRQDTVRAGRLLVSKLLDGGQGDMRPERVPTELVVRESCGG